MKKDTKSKKNKGELRQDPGGDAEPKAPSRTNFPVVGIGASAGGLEACTALLKALPTSLGMAYVIVPHLDPTRESAFPEILARSTSMPVAEVADGTPIQPDRVYVLPHSSEMTIKKGVLRLSRRDDPHTVNTAIDMFLCSLAADQGSNALAIILSGTASDGTKGVSAVKVEGGITFAQDNSAKYEGMPASAIASGCVDFILPPESIARELARISRHPYVLGGETLAHEGVGATKEAQMAQMFALLRRATGVDFSEYKPPTIDRRVARRMALNQLEELHDYVTLLQHDRNEVHALYQDLLINVTSFFRDPEVFEVLKKVVYPELVKRHREGTTPIRIWVPGCSTGEEPYSHAISLMEYLADERIEVPLQIFGTDLSESAVQRARTGLYKEAIQREVSPLRLRRFFHKIDGGYQISKAIRDVCIFSRQNVFSDPPFSRIDLLSCRNVMIYLSHTLQSRVIPIFHYALNRGGYLMIGNTEGLLASGVDLFDMADKKQKIYRKKAVPTPMTFGFAVHGAEPQPAPEATRGNTEGEPVRAPLDLQREADRILLARYAPPSIAVNEQLDIIQAKGHTGPYLELPSGRASLNLLQMARRGLLYELQNAIDEARKSGTEAIRGNVHVESNGGTKVTTIRVMPFRTPVQDRNCFLVTFEPDSAEQPPPPADVPSTPLTDEERTSKDKQISQLKQELSATKEYLQSIIEALESTNEELQSANEEIQSGNEELQSTNEELQTSKEELESANEELHTVNEEMQHRNEMLTQLNNDLSNLLNSVNLPMVMVGPDLSVRRFTPQASKVLGLTATDVGRPITRLKLKTEIENLEQMMLGVIAEVRPQDYLVSSDDGQPCQVRLTPYRTADNRIDGVVLTLIAPDSEPEDPGPKEQARGRQIKKAKSPKKK